MKLENVVAALPVPEAEHVSARLRLMAGTSTAFVLSGCAAGLGAALWWQSWTALRAGVVAGLIIGAMALVVLASHDLLDALERWSGQDIDGDGDVGGERIVLVRSRQAPASSRRRATSPRLWPLASLTHRPGAGSRASAEVATRNGATCS